VGLTSKQIEELYLADNVRFVDMTGQDSRTKISDAMGVPLCPQLDRILGYTQHGLEAKTAVVEREYVDPDYMCDYVSFYGRSYQPPSTKCCRVHFFSSRIQVGDLLSLGDAAE
jgi:hypothetical protein